MRCKCGYEVCLSHVDDECAEKARPAIEYGVDGWLALKAFHEGFPIRFTDGSGLWLMPNDAVALINSTLSVICIWLLCWQQPNLTQHRTMPDFG